MPLISFPRNEITFKIVYDGPPGSGKTASVEQLATHSDAPDTVRYAMVRRFGDRPWPYDFVALEPHAMPGFRLHFHVFSAPGEDAYASARELLLRGVEAVVFVADSRWQAVQANVEAFRRTLEALAKQGRDVGLLPIVVQLNKRDCEDAAPVSCLEALFARACPTVETVESVATEGRGVFEAFNSASSHLLSSLIQPTRGGRLAGADAVSDFLRQSLCVLQRAPLAVDQAA